MEKFKKKKNQGMATKLNWHSTIPLAKPPDYITKQPQTGIGSFR